MAEHSFSYRETLPDQNAPVNWKEIELHTGGSQSTLQDITITDRANGYSYLDGEKYVTRNRFIYWRINSDVLELSELSLDVNLSGNRVRYKFIDAPILDGVSIHETRLHVIILVPTVSSVHRLVFPHPALLHNAEDLLDSHPDLSIPSIFSELASHENDLYVYVGPSSTNSQLPLQATSCLSHDESAYFLFNYPSGELLLVQLGREGDGISTELKYESIVPKFLSGMFRSKTQNTNGVVSMVLHEFGLQMYAVTVVQDGGLRVWSCSKAQCVSVSDVLTETSGGGVGRVLELGGRAHAIRKAVGADELGFVFGVYVSFARSSHFDVLRVVINGGQFGFSRLYTLHSLSGDLIDFSLTPTRIWSVWRNESEWSVYTSTFNSELGKGTTWVPVALEPLPNPDEVPADESLDIRQLYVNYIFHPGRFPLAIIGKALSIYKRSIVTTDMNLSAVTLKQRVCVAVENEIQANLQDCEVSDEDYLDAAGWCWSNFYSSCVQLHVAGLRPLGVLLLPAVSGAVLLKKSGYSILRPLDVLEHLVLCPEHLTVDVLFGHPQLSNTKEECADVIVLANILVFMENQLTDDFRSAFDSYLQQCSNPVEAVQELTMEMNIDETFSCAVHDQLNLIGVLYTAMHKLLEILRMEQPVPENVYPKLQRTSILHLFGSRLGVAVVAQCFTQQINTKFMICRNLLVLIQCFLLKDRRNDSNMEAIRSVCMPDVVVLLQSYYALSWLSQLTTSTVLPLESQAQRLSGLKLAPVFNLKQNAYQQTSLIESFAASTGGIEAHKVLLKCNFDDVDLAHWHTALLPYLTQFSLIIWPINGNTTFSEWLLVSGQHLHLQQYVSLIESWCDWNNLTRTFLLAVSFLSTGENYKAYDLFLKASKGIYSEKFIMDRVQCTDSSKAFLLYYLKVVQLFEMHSAVDYAIEAADAALAVVLNDEEPLKATLYSIKFKHHLALGHYEEAFEALSSNPDEERKKDNLRDLVKTLLDAKRLNTLMSFNYSGMDELFFSILFTRARAVDYVANVYYDFLYAYCINKDFVRLAGSVMYEQAFRLNSHNSVEALEKQVKCYLACVNALSLADEKFRWVLKPTDPDLNQEERHILPIKAGSGEELPEIVKYKKQVEVTDLTGIRRELTFAKSRLQLARLDPGSVRCNAAGPKELVLFLASAGVFKAALDVCRLHSLSGDTVFELLTQQCVSITDEDHDAWNWLIENDLNDLDHIGNSPSSVAWTLLQTYLAQEEEPQLTRYHRVIAEKILRMGAALPYWLTASYKKRNAAELLRLYHANGFLKEAHHLAMDYLKAALGYGADHFGFASGLTQISKPFCLPVHVIDALIYEMRLQNEHDTSKPLQKEYESLKELFVKYIETSTRLTYPVSRGLAY